MISKKSNDKVVALITTKNRESFFSALNSVTNQSRKADKIVVVSDSDEICVARERATTEKHDGIYLRKRYNHAHNYAGSLNMGVDFIVRQYLIQEKHDANHIYIATLDDDDIWHQDYLKECSETLGSNPDFAVTGLIYKKTTSKHLPIPQQLSIHSFLRGNPGIQGSNTFVKLSTLMKAGCFDESMPSTTDRDIFVRIMQQNPKYVIVNKYLVNVDARSNNRITTNREIKLEGLRHFYRKYHFLMDKEDNEAFHKRNHDVFGIDEYDITDMPSIQAQTHTNEKPNNQRYEGNLIIGIIVTFEDGAKRLIKQIHDQINGEYKIILLNNTGKNLDWDDELMIRAELIDGTQNNLSIAGSRQKLQEYIFYRFGGESNNVYWLLDDDMEIKQLFSDGSETSLDIRAEIPDYQYNYDAVIGGYTNDAPLPLFSTLRLQLLDYCYSNHAKIDSHDASIESSPDNYYSLTDCGYSHLEYPFCGQNVDFEKVFEGYSQTRKLVNRQAEISEARNRGGNTLIFNKDLLLLPTCSLQIRNITARRGDFFWVLSAKKMGYKICQGTFCTFHNRKKHPFQFESEMEKLMKDIMGSSMTKAIERTLLSEEDMNGEKKIISIYTEELHRRLSRFIQSYYRIMGLLNIAGDKKYLALFSEESLQYFIRNILDYSKQEPIDAAFRILLRELDTAENKIKLPIYRSIICEYLGIAYKNLTNLGQGNEGCVFHDGKRVYKLFPKNIFDSRFLQEISKSFANCKFLSTLDFVTFKGYLIISRKYEDGGSIGQCKASDFVKLLIFGKDNRFCFNNLKPDNFIQTADGLRYIDYGKDIVPFDEKIFERSIERSFQVFKYYFLNDVEFKELISLSYAKKADAINSGLEIYKRMFDVVYKEDIHDTKVIETIMDFHPEKVLDYGAGKCKIANQLYKNGVQVDVYDINIRQMRERAGNGVGIFGNANQIKECNYDVVNCNQVLCLTEDAMAYSIIYNISRVLKPNGHFVLSICNPFFTDVQHTMLRGGGRDKTYYDASTFQEYTAKMKPIDGLEHHRPVEWYVRALRKFGFKIIDTYETDGINTDNATTIGEHLVFVCQKLGEYVEMSDLTLLIKTCAMDASTIYENIRHVVSQLEYGCGFKERIVCVDCERRKNGEKMERLRAFSEDNYTKLIDELSRAKNNGLIDCIILPEDLDNKLYHKYFAQGCPDAHSQNGQPLLMTINGFENVKTPFVFQTDCDILYFNTHFCGMAEKLSDFKNSKALTMSLGICHDNETALEYGRRVEVRNCFLNLLILNQLLPLENSIEDCCFKQTWHRCLDLKIESNHKLSIRCHDKDLFFIHVENKYKNDADLIATVRYAIGNDFFPDIQKDNVNLMGNREEWIPKTEVPIAVVSRGKNTPLYKVKRMLDSLLTQKNVKFGIVYTDANSTNASEEYAAFRLKHELRFRDSVFIPNKVDHVEIDMLMRAIQTISKDSTIIITVDNDDYLLRTDAIQMIAERFSNGADYVCGNNIRYDKPLKLYQINSFDNLWERNGDNIWLHPICFTKELFKKVDYSDMKIDGDWINVCTDFAYAVPMVQKANCPSWIEEQIYYFEPSSANQKKEGNYRNEIVNEMRSLILQRAKSRYETDSLDKKT